MKRSMRLSVAWRLRLLFVALLLPACPEQSASELSELESFGARRFKLVRALDGAPVSFPANDVTLHYDASLKAIRTEAFGNMYTLRVGAAGDGSLEWGGIEGTLMAVPSEFATAAERYTSLIVKTRRVEKRPDGMALLSRDGTKTLEYRYARP